MKNQTRKESEIFAELSQLCISKGYAHVIAYFCLRDTMIRCSEDTAVTTKNMEHHYSWETLARTEISTLIGLACKQLNTETPTPDELQLYIEKTESLLKELHYSMSPLDEIFDINQIGNKDFNPFKKASVLRESIFYGGDAAYPFQYKDLSKIKYQKDNRLELTEKFSKIYQI